MITLDNAINQISEFLWKLSHIDDQNLFDGGESCFFFDIRKATQDDLDEKITEK